MNMARHTPMAAWATMMAAMLPVENATKAGKTISVLDTAPRMMTGLRPKWSEKRAKTKIDTAADTRQVTVDADAMPNENPTSACR